MSEDTLEDKRDPGFYIIDDEIIDDFGEKLGPLGVAVYNVLVKHASRHGKSAFPSYQTIADKLGISRNSAINGVKILLGLKLIGKRARTSESGAPTSNSYKILPVKKRPKEAQEVVQNLNHPPAEIIRRGSADSALGSANGALGVVQNLHQGSADSAPEPDSSNQTPLNHTYNARERDAGSADADVCVSESRYSFEERYEHMQRNPHLTGGWLTDSKTGRFDEAIEADLLRLSQQSGTARREQTRTLMPLPAARDYVRSILSVGAGTDGKTLVEQLFRDGKVSEEVKNQLLDDLPELQPRAREPAHA